MQAVPIENIYYLLCYAWNRLDERDLIRVSSTDCENLLDLLAHVLAHGTAHLLKRGLDRGYVTTSEDLRLLRGRIDVATTAKRLLLQSSRAHCHYDELSHNVLHNRILKTTISALAGHKAIADDNRKRLTLLRRHLHQIDEIELGPSVFSRVHLNRNNAFYGFLISICHLIYTNVLAKEGDGDYLFQEFIRDPRQMGILFQEFVRNFLKCELEPISPGCQVKGAELISWDVLADEATMAKLPRMETDISVRWPNRYLVIDTKFYSQTMQTRYDSEKIRSDNLYQLFTYLQQIDSKGEEYLHCEGMLLYPTVTKEHGYRFENHGHLVMVNTINLNQPWQAIHDQLLAIVQASPAETQ